MFQTDKNLYLPIALERKAIGLLIPVRFCSSCSPSVPLIIQPPVHNLRHFAAKSAADAAKLSVDDRQSRVCCVTHLQIGQDSKFA